MCEPVLIILIIVMLSVTCFSVYQMIDHNKFICEVNEQRVAEIESVGKLAKRLQEREKEISNKEKELN